MHKPTSKNMLLDMNIKATIIVGLWTAPFKNPLLKKLNSIYRFLSIGIFLIMSSCLYIEIYYVWNKLFELMYNLNISMLYAIVTAKSIIFLYKKKRIEILLQYAEDFQNYCFSNGREKTVEIFLKYVKYSKWICIYFWLLVGIGVWILIAPSICAVFQIGIKYDENGNTIKVLPFKLYLPFDQQIYHITAIITQIFICTPGTAYIGVTDTFFFCLILNPICQLKVLQDLILNLGRYGTDSVFNSLRKILQLHQRVIFYVEVLDSLISTVMFFDFIIYSIFLCSIGARIMFDDSMGLPEFLSSFFYLCAALLQSFMFYTMGNKIMLESMEIANAAWKSDWYLFDKRVKNIMCILMVRAQKPIKIRVGRFYDLNLETLVIILRGFYSCLTLLNQMFHLN